MKRGEVWRVRIPVAPGHAQMGERPAILIQHDYLTAQLPTVLIVPLTGTLGATRFPGTLLIQPDGQNGLTIPSIALVFQTRVLDKGDVIHPLGKLDSSVLDQVINLLVSCIQ